MAIEYVLHIFPQRLLVVPAIPKSATRDCSNNELLMMIDDEVGYVRISCIFIARLCILINSSPVLWYTGVVIATLLISYKVPVFR
jgi:hypothetical protein